MVYTEQDRADEIARDIEAVERVQDYGRNLNESERLFLSAALEQLRNKRRPLAIGQQVALQRIRRERC